MQALSLEEEGPGFQGFDEQDLIERYKMQNYVYSTEPLMLKRLAKETNMNKYTKAYNLEQLAERVLTADTLDKKMKQLEKERMTRSGFTSNNRLNKYGKPAKEPKTTDGSLNIRRQDVIYSEDNQYGAM